MTSSVRKASFTIFFGGINTSGHRIGPLGRSDEKHLQATFTYLIKDAYGNLKQAKLPNAFTYAFEVLVNQINITRHAPL